MRLPREDCLKGLAQGASVLDVGCIGFRQVHDAERFGRGDLQHAGVDFVKDPVELPAGFDYRFADLNETEIPFDDDSFDFVVASHVIEHVRDPINLIADCIRVMKPGGLMYVEAPSERSLLLPGFPFKHDRFKSSSYFDDPTHSSRPWTPQSFVRLTRYLGCEPVQSKHLISWKARIAAPILIPLAWAFRKEDLLEGLLWTTVGWASFLVLRKPESMHGRPEFNYFYDDSKDGKSQ